MTFCLGMNLEQGLVGIADTRVISGNECITARKLLVYENGSGSFFIMTSGLRSVRDKTVTYFDDLVEELEEPFDRLYKMVNAFAGCVRRVQEEDGPALEKAGITFNIHTLIGGRLAGDHSHHLYLLYPQANWVEIDTGTPFHIIGQSGYGKPVLDRTLKYTDPLPFAIKVGCLAFDSTRISASDVDFPIDVVVLPRDTNQMVEHRYDREDLSEIFAWWQERLRSSVHELPSEWIETVMSKLKPGHGRRVGCKKGD